MGGLGMQCLAPEELPGPKESGKAGRCTCTGVLLRLAYCSSAGSGAGAAAARVAVTLERLRSPDAASDE